VVVGVVGGPELSGVVRTLAGEPHPSSTKGPPAIAEATQLLLAALNTAVDDAARHGSTNMGACRAAAALLDARIAVYQAVTAAGQALADRERIVDVLAAGVSTPTAA
jgi:hypothetical protein